MKRYFFYILSTAVFLLSACAKESLSDKGYDYFRTETLRAKIVSTKVEINGAGKFSWTAGDEIAVHRTANGYETVSLSADGVFNVHLAEGETRDGYAFFPASIATDAATLTVNLPSSYNISRDGMGDYSPLPMLAANDTGSEDLYFHHLGGILRLVLKGVPAETQKIGINLGKKVTGEFVVEGLDTDAPFISLSAGTPEDIVFLMNAPVRNGDSIVINIPVPVGSYESASIMMYDSYNNLMGSHTEDIDVTVERADGYELVTNIVVDLSGMPLCIKMARKGAVNVINPLGKTMKYSTDNVNWTEFSTDLEVPLNRGECVYFCGDNDTYSTDPQGRTTTWVDARTTCTRFTASTKSYVYGNVMSLINSDPDVFSTLTTITEPGAFRYMFMGLSLLGILGSEDCLQSHPSLDLLLPATTLTPFCYDSMFYYAGISRIKLPATELADYCYHSMFCGCSLMTTPPELPATTLAPYCYCGMLTETSITTAPKLPATTMAESCYQSMFNNARKLTEMPELPAMELASNCYSGMFHYCSALTDVKDLPAATLVYRCYASMFSYCESLTHAPAILATELDTSCFENMFNECRSLVEMPALPVTTLADACYNGMFKNCTSLVNARDLPALTTKRFCYWDMFNGCTALVGAPALPATTVVDHCYDGMFSGCTSLVNAPDLPATTLDAGCYRNMFSGCSSLAKLKAMFTSIPTYGDQYHLPLDGWLTGVPATGTYLMNEAALYNPVDDAGVPSGWTIETVSE